MRYDLIKSIGYGAYGIVCSAKDTMVGEYVAIKKIPKVMEDLVDGKRILREVKLLQYLRHENIIYIKDLLRPREGYREFKDLYMVTDLMETDLHQVIRSKQQLSEEHHQYFIYQTLRACRYMHAANVIHRDIKPGNLLVNGNCDLKICDFGLARGGCPEANPPKDLTDYVVTRWYRPPELLLMCQYAHNVDVWSTGCILVELLNRKPLLPGRDYLHQLSLITDVLGTPSEEDITFIKSDEALRYIRGLPKKEAKGLKLQVPKASKLALDFLEKVMIFNPQKRMGAAEALKHPYLAHLFDPADEKPVITTREPDWSFDQKDVSENDLRELFWKEILVFHPHEPPA